MPLEPQVQMVIDAYAALPAVPHPTPEQLRDGLVLMSAPAAAGAPVIPSEDRTIAGVPVRVYEPDRAMEGGPVLVWLHGGGWVIGDLASAEPAARRLAAATGFQVVSVDYRLAPEDPFPAGLDDCTAVVEMIATEAAPSAVIVGGDSAGGNLTAVVCRTLRDRGAVLPAGQLLVYPVTDGAMDTASYKENAEGYILTAELMAWFYDQYVAKEDRLQPLVSPLRASSLEGLPPAYVITAGYDPLRDEGQAYAAALRDAGVDVTESRYDGQVHGFFAQPEVFGPSAQQAVDDAAAWVIKQAG